MHPYFAPSRFKLRISLGLLALLGLLGLLAGCSPAAPPGNRPVQSIRVVMDNNYPPYTFLDSSGNLQGILVDQWKLWEQKTGIRVELTGLDWGEAQNRMAAGEFDVIDTMFFTDERAKLYDFSPPYARIDVPIFFSQKISGITDAASLRGFPVAVKSGDAAIEILKKQGIDQFQEYPSYEAIVTAASQQKVIVFVVDQPPAMYFLFKLGIEGQFNHSQPLYSGEFHRAVRRGNETLLQTVNAGFNLISLDEIQQIDQKWMGEPSPADNSIWRLIGIAGVIAAGAALLLMIWNYTLRRRVASRTQDLKKAVDELGQSEQKYRQLVANLPGVVFRCAMDESWTFLYVSDLMGQFSGYHPHDLINRENFGLLTLVDPEYRDPLIQAACQKNDQAHNFSLDLRIRNMDESLRWAGIRGQTIDGPDGNPQWLEGVIFDITERKSAEEALRESEERLRSTLESMDDLVFVFDTEMRIRNFYYSIDRQHLFRDPETAIGCRLDELDFPADIVEQFENAFRAVQETGTVQTFDYSLNLPDGMHWYNARVSQRIDSSHQFAGVTAVVRNFTEQKQIEENLHIREEEARGFSELMAAVTRASMDLSQATSWDDLFRMAVDIGIHRLDFERMGIWLLDDTDPNYLLGMFGVDESGNIRDERGQRVEVEKTIMNKALFERKSTIIFSETDILHDHIQTVVGTGQHGEAMLWDGHNAIGYISVDNLLRHQPITQQKREILLLYAQVIGHLAAIKKNEAAVRRLNSELEQRVQQRTAQLEASYREMESFTYSISHDLRAPLRTLNSFSQILQEDHTGQLDEEAKDYLRRIRAASIHMTDLMDALLRLARISRGDIQIDTIRLDLLAQEISAKLQAGNPERRVDWVISPDLTCQADPILARIVLENLLGNAWKFTSRRAAARIELGKQAMDGVTMYFVRDDGVGFDMSYADKLFSPFQRLHSAGDFEGTGVGLAIVQRIIHRHGGKIWAEGEPGKGATFCFTFERTTLQTANNS